MSRLRLLAAGLVATALAGPPAVAEPPLLAPTSHGETVVLPPLDPAVPSPAAFLGHPIGSRLSRQQEILAYLRALAEASPRVSLRSYGESYEGRPLVLLAISSPANISHLEEIRHSHLRLAEPDRSTAAERDRLVSDLPVVVWLAYGIHGNEASSSETAMVAAYVLAAAQGELAARLADAVVLLDPLENPDGRERYVQTFQERRGRRADPNPAAAEHWETWPGGRPNHYLIDLNRDWAWGTQAETRARLTAYRRWEPQVYVDFHEMGERATYYFPPPDEPILPTIDRRTLAWLDVFGRANAGAFDRQGWTYFKQESFDLFYPGYGDSYPSLRAAVGMTYEVAGGGHAGELVDRPGDEVTTLADRVARHLTTSITTVETAARNRRGLLDDFVGSRLRAMETAPTTYLWEADQPEAAALVELLERHGIRVSQLSGDAELSVAPLAATGERPVRFAAGTLAVSTRQPLGNLVRSLLDADETLAPAFLDRQRRRIESHLEAEFYDITAWSLPLAFNLTAFRMSGEPPGLVAATPPAGGLRGEGDLGFLLPPQGIAGFRAAARLARDGVVLRLALEGFTTGAERYPGGTLFVPRLGNPDDLDDRVAAAAAEAGVQVARTASSDTASGISLGSRKMVTLHPPRIGLLAGGGTSPPSVGALDFLLDRETEIPYSRLDLARLGRLRLDDFDVLVLPDGRGYDDALGEAAATTLDRWVHRGGTLVAVGGAAAWLAEHELTSVKPWEPAAEPRDGGELPGASAAIADRPLSTPGAVVTTRMRAGAPLALGLPSPPPVLVRGSAVFQPTGQAQQDVLTVAETAPVLAGFAWPEARERLAGSLLAADEPRGRGRVVVFAQDPDFRLFWRGTAPLFLNAVYYLPSLGGDGRPPQR